MTKVKYNIRKPTPSNANRLVEQVRNFDTFMLAIEFVRSELRTNENVIGKPVVEDDNA